MKQTKEETGAMLVAAELLELMNRRRESGVPDVMVEAGVIAVAIFIAEEHIARGQRGELQHRTSVAESLAAIMRKKLVAIDASAKAAT